MKAEILYIKQTVVSPSMDGITRESRLTSTATMEVLLDVPPVNEFVQRRKVGGTGSGIHGVRPRKDVSLALG